MAISEELKELYASSGTGVILHTLSFNHATWATPFHIVRDFQDFAANLEDSGPLTTFNKFAFSIKGPNKDENGTLALDISVDAVSRELIDLLELAILDTNNNPIEVTYRIYIDTDTTGPQNDPPLTLFMKSIKVTNKSINGRAELVNLVNRKFPSILYDNTFQSLVNAT